MWVGLCSKGTCCCLFSFSWFLLLLAFPLSLVLASFTSGPTHPWTGWFTLRPRTPHPCGMSLRGGETSTLMLWEFSSAMRSLCNPNIAIHAIKKGVVIVYPGKQFEDTHTFTQHRLCALSTCQPDTPTVITSEVWGKKQAKCEGKHVCCICKVVLLQLVPVCYYNVRSYGYRSILTEEKEAKYLLITCIWTAIHFCSSRSVLHCNSQLYLSKFNSLKDLCDWLIW